MVMRQGGTVVQINIPEVVAELTAAFNEYEEALLSNRPEVLDRLFWRDARTVRYGVAENLYGHDVISAYRKGAPSRAGHHSGRRFAL